MICGIIDIGANSIRLSIYRVEGKEARLLINKKETAGLASYVKNKRLPPKGMEKACLVLNSFKDILDNLNITEYHAFATASLRNIDNTEEAVTYIQAHTGMKIDVLSGEDEAALGFAGASDRSGIQSGLVIDIGGGSTEILEFFGNKILGAFSIPVGSLNMYAKYVAKIMPSDMALNRMSLEINGLLTGLAGPKDTSIKRIIGIGGTVRAAVKLCNEFFDYPSCNKEIQIEDLKQLLSRFREPDSKVVKAVLRVAPERIHTIVPGLNILFNSAEYFGAEAIVANKNSIREGYVNSRILGGLAQCSN